MNDRITLSVLLLRKHRPLFNPHGGDPEKRFLGRILHQSTRRALSDKEAERAIRSINKLRGVK